MTQLRTPSPRIPLKQIMNSKSRQPQHEQWIRGYTHFLLFFVIFSFVLTYSIVLGLVWGFIVAVIFGITGLADPGSAAHEPDTIGLAFEASWLFIAGLIAHSLLAITHERESGFRLKYSLRVFAARTVGLLLLITGGFIAFRPWLYNT